MNGAELIAEERRRQIDQEGWTHEHDDTHKEDELAIAAAVYALPHKSRNLRFTDDYCLGSALWPFELAGFKPQGTDTEGRIKELVKAGALIAAEIDRLQRKNNQLT